MQNLYKNKLSYANKLYHQLRDSKSINARSTVSQAEYYLNVIA